MKRKTLYVQALAWVLSLMTNSVGAENYPHKSDYLWVTVPNHADWVYQIGEEAEVEVQFYKYGIPRDGEVTYSIGTDLLDADMQGTAHLKGGRCVIKMGTAHTPCFRDLRLTLKLDGTVYQHHVKVGFSPEKIRPYTQEPKDFHAFWEDSKREAQAYPMKVTKEHVKEASDERTDCYLVRIELNRQHQAMYGFLMMPKDAKAGSCPVVLTPPGAGIKRIKDLTAHDAYAEKGMIRFMVEIHGLNPLMPEAYYEDVRGAFDNRVKGYLYQGLDHRDHYYMKHVYLGLMRCLDFLTSLPEWDGKNVITQGGSQGGALALITASLDQRVTLCVANHPALSDMSAAIDPTRTHGYPHFTTREGMLTEAHLRTLPYFDVVCFAPYIKAKTFMTWGYNDNTCPPTTSYTVWNLLQCEKESLVTPINEHWASDATKQRQVQWVLENIKK
jgi:cephalosporin-C deacetylase-like acetyl esterase